MSGVKLYKWSGAGNKFVVLDGRGADVSEYRKAQNISSLCAGYGTDGLMILDGSATLDFSMEFFNPDGTGGMMCGNGGRCIAAFADYLGIVPESGLPGAYRFDAPDGRHEASILKKESGNRWTVRLGMTDVPGVREMPEGLFINTGTRHFVKFVPDVEKVDVGTEGRLLRWRREFAPEGTNVDFVSVAPDGLHVRTFEKGVEGETLACGTGITASAIASFHKGIPPYRSSADGRLEYVVRAREDFLSVDFSHSPEGGFTGVRLTGPAELL